MEDLVKKHAATFAERVKSIAEHANNEEEIRIGVEGVLAVIQKDSEISLRGRHEYTIGTGRIDSVYGCVIIEYKNPRSPSAKLSSDREAKGNKEVVKQIQDRFLEFQKEQNKQLNTMFGVGCDGKYFVFVRHRNGKWFVQDPVEVTRHSSERFLWALINMGKKGKAYTPDDLAEDFGSDSRLARIGIKVLYDTICSASSPRTQVFFQEWKILFGEVCGYDIDSPSDKIGKLADFYDIGKKHRPAELLFSVHTYYAIFMKILASEIVAFYHGLPTPLQKILKTPSSAKLRDEMKDVESGSTFRHLNITNFLEGDLFSWYVDSWNDSIEKVVRDMANAFDAYNPGTLSEDPTGSRDLLKKLYQHLFPKSVRHDLGEYYTPDWLAEHVLNELNYSGNPDERLLDPACGSGTFLVMAINRVRKWYDENQEKCGLSEAQLAEKILRNIVGFDLNPLAVMASRTNYLISIRDLLGKVKEIEIPAYVCDSIMTPYEYGEIEAWTSGERAKAKELKTSAGVFRIPLEIAADRHSIARYAEQLEFCVRNQYDSKEFLQKCRKEGLSMTCEEMHEELYEKVLSLDKANKNGVWARIIKNAFAPLFCGKFDYVAGNPPWINWDSLPKEYRDDTSKIWTDYSLFPHHGMKARLGSAEDDISVLMTYCCLDHYVADGKKLGFVITQALFHSKGGGQGFRRFSLKGKGIKVLRVNDFSSFQPFEKATNKTSVMICKKGAKTSYPVPYVVWEKIAGESIPTEIGWDEARRYLKSVNKMASPISDLTSPWLVSVGKLDGIMKKATGKSASEYKARLGIYSSPVSIFWTKILKNVDSGHVLARNESEEGRSETSAGFEGQIEKEFIYPLVRGRDLDRWKYSPSKAVLIAHQKRENADKAVPEQILMQSFPKTYSYFKTFERDLRARKNYIQYFDTTKAPFWSMFNVGPYTFAPYRVGWRYIDSDFRCAVISNFESPEIGRKTAVADGKIVIIPFERKNEAHFVCAVLNSSIVRHIVKQYAVSTQIATHVTEFVRIPSFLAKEDIHSRLSSLSIECHSAASKGDFQSLLKLEREIDKCAARIWGITDDELKEIQGALA